MGAQSGAKQSARAVPGRILRGGPTLNSGGQTKHRRPWKANAPTRVQSPKTSLAEASAASNGVRGRVVLGPVIDSAAHVKVLG